MSARGRPGSRACKLRRLASAQETDGVFISDYARDFPDREDIAESVLPYFAVRYRPERLAEAGLVQGKTVGIDGTTLEANAALRSIVRRDTGEGYGTFLRGLAEASGMSTPTRAELARFDRKRPKKGSNDDWTHPQDPDAKITRMKDGRTRLAHKAEHAVDLETGAVVGITVQDADAGDTEVAPIMLAARVGCCADGLRRQAIASRRALHGGDRAGLALALDPVNQRGHTNRKQRHHVAVRVGPVRTRAPLAPPGRSDTDSACGQQTYSMTISSSVVCG